MQLIVRVDGTKIEGTSGRREAHAKGNIVVSAKRQQDREKLRI